MLASSLILATLALLPQDAASEASARQVTSFLDEAAANLYDPAAMGLRSLSFDFELMMPLGPGEPMKVAMVEVDWTQEAGPSIDVTPVEDLTVSDPQVQAMLPMLKAQIPLMGEGRASQILETSLNMHYEKLRGETFDAALAGVEDGMVKLHFASRNPDVVPDTDWLFDDENVAQRSSLSVTQSMPAGEMTMEITQDYTWRAVSDEDDRLVLASVEQTQDMGMMKMAQTTTFDYGTIGDILVLTGFTETLPEVMGMGGGTITTKLTNIAVNAPPGEQPSEG